MKNIILTSVLLSSFTVSADWNTKVSTSEMSGVTSYHANSHKTLSTKDNKNLERSWLSVGCSGDKKWILIGFEKTPIPFNGDDIVSWVKFDSDAANDWGMTQKTGRNFIRFNEVIIPDGDKSDDRYLETLIYKITNKSNMKIQFDIYKYGDVVFKYDLTGASSAISKTLKLCSTKG